MPTSDYVNMSCIGFDITNGYLRKLPEFITYSNMYQNFWIQGFAIKLKLTGPTVPLVNANIRT